MRIVAITVIWLFAVLVLYGLAHAFAMRLRTRRRLFELDLPSTPATGDYEPNALQRWLFLAGFRRPNAASTFVMATAGTLLLGLSVAYALQLSGIVASADRAVSGIPGGVGDIFRPALYIGPWLVLVTLALGPALFVRRARRNRVSLVEQDLPVMLELLSTLAEAGLGFDAAVNRILSAQPAERPLATELRTLQVELLSGRQRVDCLRRVGRRLEVGGVTTFVSALVQAEQVGAGVANVLRQQADDLRQRRRERATELSMSLPVKRLFPMVICFLPGIMLFTLGPTFHEFFKYADTIIRLRHP